MPKKDNRAETKKLQAEVKAIQARLEQLSIGIGALNQESERDGPNSDLKVHDRVQYKDNLGRTRTGTIFKLTEKRAHIKTDRTGATVQRAFHNVNLVSNDINNNGGR